jgi:hypothetical protein
MRFWNLQKPSKLICWAFLFLQLALPVQAGFKEKHWDPVRARAFDSTSQKILLAGFLSTGLLSTQDSAARDQHRDNRTMSASTADWGDQFSEFLVGPAIALGQFRWDTEEGESHARALIYTSLVTHTLKNTLRRERPYGGNFQAMPSGHTSSAFATATSLTYSYGASAGLVFYPVATFVALSRISDDVHWLSDTVAGAFIGIWMGRAAHGQAAASGGSIVWIPVLSSQAVGVLGRIDF